MATPDEGGLGGTNGTEVFVSSDGGPNSDGYVLRYDPAPGGAMNIKWLSERSIEIKISAGRISGFRNEVIVNGSIFGIELKAAYLPD